jgi:5-methylcytosine-specific restriction endonuclease McrA
MGKRSSSHIKVQNSGKVRDLFTCQICGSKDKPEGHHILDVFFGGAAVVENIITLCSDHHKKVHSNKISLTKF